MTDVPENEKKISTKRLILYFALAYAGAALLIVLAVLPARYGVDPLGIGKVTGISEQAVTREEILASGDAPSETGFAHIQDAPFKSETIRLEIEDLAEVEYKMVMPEGATFVYSWRVEGPTEFNGVYYEFHGHPGKETRDQYPDDFFKSYDKGEAPSGNGGFTAGFAGYHGWFFMNVEEGPITILLDVAGYYDDHIEIYRSIDGEVVIDVEY